MQLAASPQKEVSYIIFEFMLKKQSPNQQQQLERLIDEEIKHLMKDSSCHQSSTEEEEDEHIPPNNVYFDKQLTHLVLSEEFDFSAISHILTEVFRFEHMDTSEPACRIRWAYLHSIRNKTLQINERVKEEKRTRSVAAFSNPYSLYSVDELIEDLQAKQLSSEGKQETPAQEAYSGYNIFKDNFREIKDMEEYNAMKEKMKKALEMAQQEIYEEKPLFFSPQYENSGSFEVVGEELTAEKMRKLMAYQIEMEKVNRELTREMPEEREKYERAIMKRVEKAKKGGDEGGDFDQNWDEYESD